MATIAYDIDHSDEAEASLHMCGAQYRHLSGTIRPMITRMKSTVLESVLGSNVFVAHSTTRQS